MSLREEYAGPSVLLASSGGPEVSGSHRLAGRLVGVRVPAVALPFAPDALVSLVAMAYRRSLVVFFYEGVVQPGGGESREGSVGMARVLAWRDREPELERLGYRVVGVSTTSPEVQALFASDEFVQYMLLSDGELELARELGLPTRSLAGGERVYEPLTMIVKNERIAHVFYPIIDPARGADTVMAWIGREHA